MSIRLKPIAVSSLPPPSLSPSLPLLSIQLLILPFAPSSLPLFPTLRPIVETKTAGRDIERMQYSPKSASYAPFLKLCNGLKGAHVDTSHPSFPFLSARKPFFGRPPFLPFGRPMELRGRNCHLAVHLPNIIIRAAEGKGGRRKGRAAWMREISANRDRISSTTLFVREKIGRRASERRQRNRKQQTCPLKCLAAHSWRSHMVDSGLG